MDESILQKAFKEALRKASLVKRTTCEERRDACYAETMQEAAKASIVLQTFDGKHIDGLFYAAYYLEGK